MTQPYTLILASASPRRRELLAKLGVSFVVQPSPLDEPPDKPEAVELAAWAEALAYFKANAVAEGRPDAWVLGADTIVACAGRLLGKPRDREDARRMLHLQAGRACDVITGVALVRGNDAASRRISHCVTRVWMRDDPGALEDYLHSGGWAGKAGAYGIQDVGDRLVERIEGSFSNVVGLPLECVRELLAHAGIQATPDGVHSIE